MANMTQLSLVGWVDNIYILYKISQFFQENHVNLLTTLDLHCHHYKIINVFSVSLL